MAKEGSAYAFLSMYALLFIIFIVVPVMVALLLSFTFFDAIQPPRFIGLSNYIALLTQDDTFMKYVLPNTIQFAVIVGPGGYVAGLSAGLDAGAAAQDPPHDLCADPVLALHDRRGGDDGRLENAL